jgi:hypothetical protein
MRTRIDRENQVAAAAATIVKGAAAGLAGTLAMDLVWYRRYRSDGGVDSFRDWEFSAGTRSYDEAGAPAQVGKRVTESLLQRELPPESARTMNNVVHWSTGALWGTAHGIAAASLGRSRIPYGLATGLTAWAASYALLAPAKIYKPAWEYPPSVLWKDLSAHLVFGTGLAAAFQALTAR